MRRVCWNLFSLCDKVRGNQSLSSFIVMLHYSLLGLHNLLHTTCVLHEMLDRPIPSYFFVYYYYGRQYIGEQGYGHWPWWLMGVSTVDHCQSQNACAHLLNWSFVNQCSRGWVVGPINGVRDTSVLLIYAGSATDNAALILLYRWNYTSCVYQQPLPPDSPSNEAILLAGYWDMSQAL